MSEKQPASLKGSKSSSNVELKQRFGLMNGISLIVSTIVGSGIFLSPSVVQKCVGSAGVALIVWVLSGFVSMMGALCYVELGMTIPKSGGNYAYIREIFGGCLGFVRGWVSVLIIEPVVCALISKVSAEYLLKPWFLTCSPPQTAINLIAVCICLCIVAMNSINIDLANKINSYLSYSKIVAMLLVVVIGMKKFIESGFEGGALEDPWQTPDKTVLAGKPFTFQSIIFGVYNGVYSYVGWDCLNYMNEEIKNPKKNLPYAIYIALPLITVIYIMVNVAYLTVLTSDEMTESNAVAITFIAKTMGREWTYVMSVLVFLSTFGTVNAVFNFTSRMYFTVAREKQFPAYFAMVSPDHLTPIPSLLLLCCMTMMYMGWNNIGLLINYYSFIYWLTVAIAVTGTCVWRVKRPEMDRPIKFPVWLSAVFAAICYLLVLAQFIYDTENAMIGAAILVSGFPVYFFFFWRDGKYVPGFLHKLNESGTRFLQKLCPVVVTKQD